MPQVSGVPIIRVEFENERVPTGKVGIGGCVDVTHAGAFLYALQGRSLKILSLAQPAEPRLVGTLADLGNLRQIAVRGTTAFITAREDGLFVVDVSAPASPRLIARYDTVEFATGIEVRDGFAFIACRWFGVEIVDVSVPAQPRHVANMRVGEAQSCEVADGFLYAGAWEERRVAICDVRNPASPRQVATVRLGGRGDGVCVRAGILYAATGHHRPGSTLSADDPRYGTGNGMDICDVSDPANPRQLSRIDFGWRFYYGWPDTWRVKVSHPYAYLSHTYHGVLVFDVSDPRAPREVAQIRLPLYPGDPDYRELGMKSANGLRPPLLPFDPKEKLYSPVCGLVATDGFLYLAGLFSDLHVLADRELARAESEPSSAERLACAGDFHRVDLASLREALRPVANRVAHYRPGGQVYAAVEGDGLVYAACGAGGIRLLDRDLRPLACQPTEGFATDVQLAGPFLYAAEGSGGLVRYRLDGGRLEMVNRRVFPQPVKQVRVSPDGRYAVLHVGGSVYEVLDVSGEADMRPVRTERGWGGLIYYRQLCNGFVDGRYICGTWCAGRTFLLDCGGTEPQPLPDVTGILPDMETGGYCPCGSFALLTREGGYSFFPPGYEGAYGDLPVQKPRDGSVFYGKPTCRDGLLVVCNRIGGEVTFVDVSNLTEPRILCQFTVSGNPDCAFVGEDSILLPVGYQGLFRIAR